jgi:hypothetical protein
MKYINKSSKYEPITLRRYRETTDNATYSGFVDTEQKIKKGPAFWNKEISVLIVCNEISLKQKIVV